MICDRVVIVRCIEAWFGSVEHFETAVRGEVRRASGFLFRDEAFRFFTVLGFRVVRVSGISFSYHTSEAFLNFIYRK